MPCFHMFVPLMPVAASRFPTSINSVEAEKNARTVLFGREASFAKPDKSLRFPFANKRRDLSILLWSPKKVGDEKPQAVVVSLQNKTQNLTCYLKIAPQEEAHVAWGWRHLQIILRRKI